MSEMRIRAAIHAPASDETLSSVLDRSANFWDMDRQALLSAMGAEAWNDFDAPPPTILNKVATMTGFSQELLAPLALQNSEDVLLPDHRTGYCPLCWEDDVSAQLEPYFRRSWTSTAALACSRHGALLYSWGTDAQGRRQLPLLLTRPGDSQGIWRSDLEHAKSNADMRVLKQLIIFARKANAALVGDIAWPSQWRGSKETGRALMALLSTNPAPFPERLPMDLLVPDGPDARWFADHHRLSSTARPDKVTPIRRMAEPAIRRTLWWLFGRTIAVNWKPMQLHGCFTVLIGIESWWHHIGRSISGHAMENYFGLGEALGLQNGMRRGTLG